ncbi:MAG: RDD family protein [Bacteroides sp.]|nr:RDD family protein [Bacteroides sp.]
MADSTILTGQYVTIDQMPASVGERILARLLDYLFIFLYLVFVATLTQRLRLYRLGDEAWIFILYFLLYFPAVFYSLLMEVFNNGQSLGKRLMNIRVMKVDGSTPTVSSYLLRWLLYGVDRLCGIGLFIMIFSSKSQRLGDMAAGTLVVKERNYRNVRVSLREFDYLAQGYQPVFPEAADFTLQQIELISRALNTPTKDRSEKISQLAGKIRPKLSPGQSTLNDTFLLETIVKDFHYYALEESI